MEKWKTEPVFGLFLLVYPKVLITVKMTDPEKMELSKNHLICTQ